MNQSQNKRKKAGGRNSVPVVEIPEVSLVIPFSNLEFSD